MKKIYVSSCFKYNEITRDFDKKSDTFYRSDELFAFAGGGGESGGGGGGGYPATQTTIQQADPWTGQQPYLTKGFAEAENRMLNYTPEFYPDSTVVPFSPETLQAMDLTTQRALAGSPINAAARDQLTSTLAGDYLYGGPGFDAAVQAATNKALPGIDSQFALRGRYGSGLMDEARTRAISDAFADQYSQERTNQLRAMMFAPQVAESDYSDIGKLAAVGAQKEAMDQENLSDQIARHDYEQSVDQRQLQEYMNLIQGQYGGTTTTTSPLQQQYYQGSSGGNILGTALTGVGLLGSLFGGGGGGGFGGILGSLVGL